MIYSYRMSPEVYYPENLNDCYKVTLHIIKNSKQLGVDIERLVLAGDSAGGKKRDIIFVIIII